MLGSAFRRRPDRLDAAARVKRWTRERFSLNSESTLLVSELESAQPGFPPLSTVVAFWIAEKHYHFRVFKPLAQVREEDLPPAWYRDALEVPAGGAGCDCC